MTLLRRGVWAYLRVPYCGWEKNVGILFRFIVPRLKRLPPPPPPPPLLLKTTPTLLTYDLHTHTPHASTPPTPVCREHRLASKLPKVPRGVFSSPNGQAVFLLTALRACPAEPIRAPTRLEMRTVRGPDSRHPPESYNYRRGRSELKKIADIGREPVTPLGTRHTAVRRSLPSADLPTCSVSAVTRWSSKLRVLREHPLYIDRRPAGSSQLTRRPAVFRNFTCRYTRLRLKPPRPEATQAARGMTRASGSRPRT